KILEPLGLIPFAHSVPGAMNSSWQQRVALARGLALRPEILLLDKPLVGVELRQRSWWFEFLKKLFEGVAPNGIPPMAIVVATEDIAPWIDVATHFVALKKKRWQFLGNR